jgi:mannose-6-phosphate isomerase-like protein (cupin superfamily)
MVRVSNNGHPNMLNIIASPTTIRAAGSPPKLIEEFFGRVASGTEQVSIARMTSPSGWQEPGQTPEFDEFTVVVRGQLRVETRSDAQDISAGQAIHVPRGQWVRYSTPGAEGAEYFSVCLPAFSPKTVHRDEG